MGYLPQLSEIGRDRDMVREFLGMNHNPVIGNGQFFEMRNLSSDDYPVLTTRKRRTVAKAVSGGLRMFAGDHMAWISSSVLGGAFYYNGAKKFDLDIGAGGVSLVDQIRMVRMGAYICIFPHGIVYNTQDDTVSKIAQSIITGQAAVGMNPVIANITPDGSREWTTLSVDSVTASETEPSDTSKYWLQTGSGTNVLKKYSTAMQVWVSIPTMYASLSIPKSHVPDISSKLKAGDAITFSGFTGTMEGFNGSFLLEDIIIVDTAVSFIVIAQNYPNTVGGSGIFNLTITREMPNMQFVCENQNRLFGCSYDGHEVYASKLGDPLNWNVFTGISTDSYAATVGTAGDFTGIASYRNSVLFFKTDCIHILTGTRPANFQIETLECRGMQRLSDRSAVVVNETLFYKSDHGIMAYSGNLPQLVSEALGDYNTGHVLTADTDGKKYYCCMMVGDNQFRIFAYDVSRNIWSCEDDLYIRDFASIGNELYMMDASGNIHDLNTSTSVEIGGLWKDANQTEESMFEWSATSGAIGLDSPYEKYIASIILRVQMEMGAVFRVETSYDESDNFTEVMRITADRLRSVTLNIVPRRCDTMRIRLSGYGAFKLYSISKEIETGGISNGGI